MTDWILAIETVATAGSVALVAGGELRAERVLPPESRSARTLGGAVRGIWDQAGRPKITVVAVASGPGSFTGLRVGITTAKTLAYAWGAKLLGVSTLDAIAAGVGESGVGESGVGESGVGGQGSGDRSQGSGVRGQELGRLQVVIEAQRRELFVGVYEYLNGNWCRATEDSIVGVEDWLAKLTPGTIVCGPPLKKLGGDVPAGVKVLPETMWQPRAIWVALLGLEKIRSGAADELWTLIPNYLRPSYAEEKKPLAVSAQLAAQPLTPEYRGEGVRQDQPPAHPDS